jgi:hypothetical protein
MREVHIDKTAWKGLQNIKTRTKKQRKKLTSSRNCKVEQRVRRSLSGYPIVVTGACAHITTLIIMKFLQKKHKGQQHKGQRKSQPLYESQRRATAATLNSTISPTATFIVGLSPPEPGPEIWKADNEFAVTA